jgi:two-component system chemotaxis response regulator CheY
MEQTYHFERMSVLLVDDNKHMQRLVSTILQGFGIRDIVAVSNPATVLKELESRPIDLVICEY